MPRLGFIRDKDKIKYLILFSMDLLPFAVPFDTIVDLVTWCDEGFGYFELSEAFYEMLPTGHIVCCEEHQDTPLYAITDKGREAAAVLHDQLPAWVRKQAERSTLRVVRQLRRNACVHTQTTAHAPDDLVVRMELDEVFALEMHVVSKRQATMLENVFQQNAEALYQVLLTAFTADYTNEDTP